MPARETEAIILKTFALGEADRLVSFLGRTSGRMRGVAAGARRIKNRYGSTLELLAHVQLWYVERETRDLVRIQQAELLESFNKSQSDYELSTSLALVSETVELVLPEHEPSEPMFRLILLTVREVERRGNGILPLSYFAFWTVRLAGWLPRFDACADCGKPFGSQVGVSVVGISRPVLRRASSLGHEAGFERRPPTRRSLHAGRTGQAGRRARVATLGQGTARSGAELDRASHRAKARNA